MQERSSTYEANNGSLFHAGSPGEAIPGMFVEMGQRASGFKRFTKNVGFLTVHSGALEHQSERGLEATVGRRCAEMRGGHNSKLTKRGDQKNQTLRKLRVSGFAFRVMSGRMSLPRLIRRWRSVQGDPAVNPLGPAKTLGILNFGAVRNPLKGVSKP
jgi:hypothetical protein